MNRYLAHAFLVLSLATAAFTQQSALRSVHVNGVTLHYLDQGRGTPLIFVHGGMEDYRAWDAQISPVAKSFRVIAYSKRFNYPNQNAIRSRNHSAIIDAEDLAALMHKLKLGPAHIVGHSYGAYTAMFLALRHPELVRSLVLSEPPLMKWLNDLPAGKPLLDDFMSNMWLPCASAFRRHDPDTALRITVDWFGSHEAPASGESATYASLPAEVRTTLMQDIREWEALTTSEDAFPPISHKEAAKISEPVLLLSGDHSVQAFRLIAAELARTLPHVQFQVLSGASHEMWSEMPQELTNRIEPFLSTH
ncbi:MAG TPA: alpha/beta hydrolase [Candidatus Angelobacter sp.]|nr:alpha/beta hydrolase [Candidatus Angelobacter sp.]